jgi:CheY-like chemotaxis protein
LLQTSDSPAPRVLVVDDDLEIRRILRQLLAPAGYVVEEFATGNEALDRIQSDSPDLVLLDLRLRARGPLLKIPMTPTETTSVVAVQ